MKHPRSWSLFVAAVTMVALMASPALGVSPHFVGTPECRLSGNSVVCSFSVAGLGRGNVDITVNVPGGCANKPGHEPPGHIGTTLTDVPVRAGRVTVTNLSIGSVECPPGLHAILRGPATVTVSRAGEKLFTGTIDVAGL